MLPLHKHHSDVILINPQSEHMYMYMYILNQNVIKKLPQIYSISNAELKSLWYLAWRCLVKDCGM